MEAVVIGLTQLISTEPLFPLSCSFTQVFASELATKTKRAGTHLFPGLSRSRSFRTDLPSISGGVSSPAISRIVGARSIFRTI